jgi:alkylresorcinol/alkylpyrone synthase
MFINGLGIALPPRTYTQAECWKALQSWERFQKLSPRSQAILRKVLLSGSGIATRHMAMDRIEEVFDLTPDAMHARFLRHAPALATEAAQRALANARRRVEDIDAVIVSTCTGYLCPGLTSYVGERLKLRADVLALDLVGQGCGAALPNLRAAEALIAARRCGTVLSVCVEVCSAALFLDDDPGVLISACLFGDGAGAAITAAESAGQARPVEWKEAGSILDPASRDLLRFEQRGGMLRNILTPPVPVMAAQYAEKVFRDVAQRADVKRKEIASWIFHAGGRDVLVALRERFDLREADMLWSASVLRDVGNISSPFVFHVLKKALNGGAKGGWWWLSSFGAGFTCHGALLEVA